jgi:hypothetical protein
MLTKFHIAKWTYLINLQARGFFIFKKSFDLLLVIEQQAEYEPLGFIARG